MWGEPHHEEGALFDVPNVMKSFVSRANRDDSLAHVDIWYRLWRGVIPTLVENNALISRWTRARFLATVKECIIRSQIDLRRASSAI